MLHIGRDISTGVGGSWIGSYMHVYMHMYQVCRVTKNVWTLAGDDHSPLQTHRVPGQAQATELVLADFVAQSGFY